MRRLFDLAYPGRGGDHVGEVFLEPVPHKVLSCGTDVLDKDAARWTNKCDETLLAPVVRGNIWSGNQPGGGIAIGICGQGQELGASIDRSVCRACHVGRPESDVVQAFAVLIEELMDVGVAGSCYFEELEGLISPSPVCHLKAVEATL